MLRSKIGQFSRTRESITKMKLHLSLNDLIIIILILSVLFTSIREFVFISSEVTNNFYNTTSKIYEQLPDRIYNRTKFAQISELPGVGTLDFIGPWLNGMKYHDLFFNEKNIPEEIEVVHMKNLYVTRQCIFYDNYSYYYVRPTCQFEYGNTLHGSKTVIDRLESVIAICHLWTHNYAHMIFDVLVPMSLLPQKIIDQSFILVTAKTTFVKKVLKIYGFNEDRILFMRLQDLVECENLYTVHPHSFYNLQRITMQKFRTYCVRKFNLDQVPPFRFVLFNRKGSRSLANFDEVYCFLERNYPQFQWEHRISYEEASNTILYFNEILLFFGPHGADFASMVFLQESSIVCEIQPATFVSCYLIISNLLGFHHIIGRLPLMEFDTYSHNVLPLTVANQMIEQVLHYID
ncbi:hypothetical protein TRFO_25053 [Tritrichomonas foetus]|uniref:Glycosyltransferase 61 catalytic domain-containing protein n=1 Tax=Tritrichomonas foetus TaxID=1144522 RepID=A0A1J4K628_9EUKA|nr:hypothetical protein TRFO_25053 [Tritrichomonas foetus]|eukprot:OHT06871.1 hypothetical protein TRFO_25053 [Tritrichomonas foetus]